MTTTYVLYWIANDGESAELYYDMGDVIDSIHRYVVAKWHGTWECEGPVIPDIPADKHEAIAQYFSLDSDHDEETRFMIWRSQTIGGMEHLLDSWQFSHHARSSCKKTWEEVYEGKLVTVSMLVDIDEGYEHDWQNAKDPALAGFIQCTKCRSLRPDVDPGWDTYQEYARKFAR